ncbi:transcription antitermination factor NusB [Candidatus Parcubacteria bacterium]|nr:transcription antitermination factor NusB [Candidatus Parcubacteria bacterium]
MANRHLSRSIVLQSLYEWDFGHKSQGEAFDIFKRNAEEFAPGMGDFSFMDKLLRGVMGKQRELDTIIEKAAPDWPIDKISVVDRNILRLGLYELLFSDRKEVPAKVAINEAIELAKNYGSDTSSKFVNGVLGAVYKEIGEPGKDETSKKKFKDVPDKDLPIEHLSGAVVYAREADGQVYLALIHDIFGHWTLTKGKLQGEENLEAGTIRNVKDELGLDIEIREKLDENTYVAFNPETGKKKKHVTYFLVESPFNEIKLEEKGGLDDAKWFKLKDILELNFYNDILPIVTKAINIILAQK